MSSAGILAINLLIFTTVSFAQRYPPPIRRPPPPPPRPRPISRQNPPQSCTNDPCFTVRPGAAISCAQPFERRSSISCQECLDLCKTYLNRPQYPCKAVVYDYGRQTCDIFAVDKSQYPLVCYRCRSYFEPKTGGYGSCSIAPTTPAYTTTPTPNIPDAAKCPAGQVSKFLFVSGYELQASDDVTLNTLSLQDCINICKNNQNRDGSVLPCVSFDYDGSCKISRQAAAPKGTGGELKPVANGGYYEKLCVSSAVNDLCPGDTVTKVPESVLVGFAQQVIDVASEAECISSCINSQQLFSNFKCVSGMFYAQISSQNCILNIETKDTKPDLFIKDTTDKANYFQLNCGQSTQGLNRLRAVQARNVSSLRLKDDFVKDADLSESLDTWTSWSGCSLQNDKAIRYRRCPKKDIRLCPAEVTLCDRHPSTNVRDSKVSGKIPKEWVEGRGPVRYADVSKNQPYARAAIGNQLVIGTIIDEAPHTNTTSTTGIDPAIIFTDAIAQKSSGQRRVTISKPTCRCARNICSERPVDRCDLGILVGSNGTQSWCFGPNGDLDPVEYC